MKTLIPSLIRTIVPIVVGWLIALPVTAQLGITDDQLTQAVTVAVTGIFYLAARYAEEHWSEKFGWLLGLAKAPAYGTTATIPAAPLSQTDPELAAEFEAAHAANDCATGC